MRCLIFAVLAASLLAGVCLADPGVPFGSWAGYNWKVKKGTCGPNENKWSPDLVKRVGNSLQFWLKPINGTWTSSEVWTDIRFGPGTFYFVVKGAFEKMAINTVAGWGCNFNAMH